MLRNICCTMLAAAVLFACSSHAPPSDLEVPTPQARMDLLRERLDLSPAQMDAMLPILVEEHEENSYRVESLKSKSGYKLKHAQRRIREEFQVRREITRDAFADILTPEQLALYDALAAEKQPGKRTPEDDGRPKKSPGPRPESM